MADIAVVDDELLMRDLIKTSLSRLGHQVEAFDSGDSLLKDFVPHKFDLVITDMKMPGISGMDLSGELLKQDEGLSIVLMTAYGTIESAVSAMKMGVADFIEKPFRVERLEHTVSKVLNYNAVVTENRQLKKTLQKRYQFIGHSSQVKELLGLVADIAASKSTVLVTGESGTGKELIAHAIHYGSQRVESPFIKINCSAIPEPLMESELFGHEKGAFTGAIRQKVGKFELANAGTILLDEIGEMPLPVQSKLLRILQERELTRVGGNDVTPIDVRVIGTTNRDLEKEVRERNFREDLFYRLNVIPVKVPSLRERREDIPLLVDYFIEKYNEENGFRVPGISQAALKLLEKHNWPGNVRELENVVQRAVVFAKHREIDVVDTKVLHAASPQESNGLHPGMTIAEGERQLIIKTLKASQNNRTKASELLGISVRTLRNKLNEYRIRDKSLEP